MQQLEFVYSVGDPLTGSCGYIFDDGGRAAAGFRGCTGDCVVRAIAIATQTPYADVYAAINEAAQAERPRRNRKRSSVRTGVHQHTTKRYLTARGWQWVPTMEIGQGCRVHLHASELPLGRLIVAVSRHLVAVVDRVVHDVEDPRREGTRSVYGYFQKSDTSESRTI